MKGNKIEVRFIFREDETSEEKEKEYGLNEYMCVVVVRNFGDDDKMKVNDCEDRKTYR